MSRVFNQKNVWGSPGGPNPQRADLWGMDFSQVVKGLNDQIRPSANSKDGVTTNLKVLDLTVESYFVSSVSLPTLGVKAEEFKRDSRPYMMPGFDEPLSEIRVVFLMDSPIDAKTSKIYRFLDTWRAFVRAGRGSLGGERSIQQLSQLFKVIFRFPATITLLRGNASGTITNISQTFAAVGYETGVDLEAFQRELAGLPNDQKNARMQSVLANAGLIVNAVNNPLEDCAVFQVENMWLSKFKVTDLDYSKGNELTRIEATFYADNICDLENKQE